MIDQLEREYPGYFSIKYKTTVGTVSDIQRDGLGEEDIFIEYFAGKSRIFSFVIIQNDFFVHEHPRFDRIKMLKEDVKKIVSTLPHTISKKSCENFRDQSYELYNLLFPYELAAKKRLIIIPDGMLSDLPFEILLTEKKALPNFNYYKNLSYLGRGYPITYHYSGTLFLENIHKNQEITDTKCLAFAPSYGGTSDLSTVRGNFQTLRNHELSALPGAQKEIKSISGHMDGLFLFGSDATEKNFKNEVPGYDIIHLAMHGLTNNEFPMYSKLIFSNSEDGLEDDTLYAYEIYNLNLAADLVVLSACETGSGKYVRGEGTMSLARGFMYVGIPSVIQTLWSASDESSASLISYFYEGLAHGLSKDKAIWQAKLRYLENNDGEFLHPFYWSGFILYGDNRPVALEKYSWNYLFLIIGLLFILFLVVRLLRRNKIGFNKKI